MNVTALFEKIAGRQQERQHRRIEDYRELVAAMAVGEVPAAETVERTLADAGKSLDDLRADVEHYQRRMALKAAVAAIPNLDAERRDIDKQIAEADRLLEAAEKRHDETTFPLYERRRAVTEALSEGSRAVTELVLTCNDPDLRRQWDEIQAELHRLANRHRELTQRAAFMEERARTERERADRELTPAECDARQDVAARYKRDLNATRRALEQLRRLEAALVQRRERLEDRMRQA